MLILSRRAGETIYIDNGTGTLIQIIVLGVKGNQVRIGIVAPPDVPVHRKEIYERIQRGDELKATGQPVIEAVANG